MVDDSVVDVRVVDGQVVVALVSPVRYTLDALLADVTDDNVHQELPAEPSMGDEVW